jgi:hypothetical protein
MRRCFAALLVAAASLFGAQASAHHSFGATYLEDRTMTIEGQLVQLLFRNPHSFVHVMVREKDGTVVRYAVEWSGALQLAIARDTLRIGDRVVISGYPGRNRKDHLLRMLTLHRPKDGFEWGQRPGEIVE